MVASAQPGRYTCVIYIIRRIFFVTHVVETTKYSYLEPLSREIRRTYWYEADKYWYSNVCVCVCVCVVPIHSGHQVR